MRTVRRLRLRILLDLRSSPTVLSTHVLVALSNLGHPHQKQFSSHSGSLFSVTRFHELKSYTHSRVLLVLLLLVEVGGFAPPSRTLFSLLHTAITHSIYLFLGLVNCFGDDIIHLCVCICYFVQLLFGHHVCVLQTDQVSS